MPEDYGNAIRAGQVITYKDVKIASIDMVINTEPIEDIVPGLEMLAKHEQIRVMIHEQYFYRDYPLCQENFEQKLETAFSFLKKHGYASCFFEEIL